MVGTQGLCKALKGLIRQALKGLIRRPIRQALEGRPSFRRIPTAQTQTHGPLYVHARNYDGTKPITRNTLVIARKQLVFAVFYCIFGLQKVKEA